MVTFVVLLVAPAIAAAQSSGGAAREAEAALPDVEGWFSNLTRVETWRFFEPRAQDVDPDYTFVGNRSDLGVRARGVRFDVIGAFRYVRLQRLPTNAIGPGGLGTGPFYYAATGLPYSYQVFFTDLSATWHTPDRRLQVTAGRMRYTSGTEGDADGRAMSAHFVDVRQLGLAGRTLGTFDWSLYQRRYDGVRVDWSNGQAYGGSGVFMPSQGGFEASANLPIPRIQVGTSWAGWRHGSTAETQVSGQWYRDRRGVDIRPDNAGIPVTRADITLWTAGLSHARTARIGDGEADVLAWGAVQSGDWYGDAHRAWSGTLQAGYQWTAAPWRPWVRGGWSYASGDEAARDGRHGTWFPMLADTRSQALSMVYAPMNLRDVFGQVLLEPRERLRLRIDLHRLELASGADRWYQGSGATSRTGRFFGYSTRVAGGHTGLGTMLEGTADVRLTPYWSINGYVGRMWGGPLVQNAFAGNRLLFWYVENVLALKLTH